MNIKGFFAVPKEETKRWENNVFLATIGGLVLLALWQMLGTMHLLKNGLVPTPLQVMHALPLLWGKYDLLGNTLYSITLNLLGYLEAALIGLPLGFILGLNRTCRSMFGPYVTSMRYLPLSAMLGPFMLACGISTNMKVQFLAFGLLVYIVPQIMQRIYEVEEVYLQMMRTIGASRWQTIRRIYFPAVIARVFTDFVNLTGISWTYIIIAEVVNTSDGGIGAVAYMAYRTSHIDLMYAALIVIVIVGFAFDRIGNLIDRSLFRWKYAGNGGK